MQMCDGKILLFNGPSQKVTFMIAYPLASTD